MGLSQIGPAPTGSVPWLVPISSPSSAPCRVPDQLRTVIEAPKPVVGGPQVWPLGVKAYHALGDLGLIPEKTELLYGQIFHKIPKSPFHRLLLMRLLELLQRILPPGLHVQPEQPILCGDSEPEPDLSVIRGSINDYLTEHPAPPNW